MQRGVAELWWRAGPFPNLVAGLRSFLWFAPLGAALRSGSRRYPCDTLGSMSHLRLPTMELSEGLLARLRPLAGVTGTPGVMYAWISEDREGAGLGWSVNWGISVGCSLSSR
jgi:hypothetical protein